MSWQEQRLCGREEERIYLVVIVVATEDLTAAGFAVAGFAVAGFAEVGAAREVVLLDEVCSCD